MLLKYCQNMIGNLWLQRCCRVSDSTSCDSYDKKGHGSLLRQFFSSYFINETEMYIIFQEADRGQRKSTNWEVGRWWEGLNRWTSRPKSSILSVWPRPVVFETWQTHTFRLTFSNICPPRRTRWYRYAKPNTSPKQHQDPSRSTMRAAMWVTIIHFAVEVTSRNLITIEMNLHIHEPKRTIWVELANVESFP